jgi:hypothetical protein
MQLTYRGVTYTPASEAPQTQPFTMLYRGVTYERSFSPMPCPQVASPAASPFKLIYRGQTYDYSPQPAQPRRQPQALNWRYQFA